MPTAPSPVSTTKNTTALTGFDSAELVVRPVIEQSVALRVCRVFTSNAAQTRVPIVAADPLAEWLDEAQPIPVSQGDITEVVVTPSAVKGASVISNELANDSSPDARRLVGDGLVRGIVSRVDEAFLGAPRTGVPAPDGLASVAASVTTLDRVADGPNLEPDDFIDAVAAAEGQGATISTFIVSAADMLHLAKLKAGAGSEQPLLAADPTQPTRRIVNGVPLVVSRHLSPGTAWGIPTDRVLAVVRKDASVEVDTSVAFLSDATALRCVMRVGFAYPHPAAIVRIKRS